MRRKVEIDLYTPEDAALDFAGQEASETILGLLAHKGITYHPGCRLASVDAAKRELCFDDGRSAGFNLLIVAPDQRPPTVVRDAGLVDGAGWVPAKQPTAGRVFAAGDVATACSGSGDLRSADQAEHEAIAAARAIAFRLGYGPPPEKARRRARLFIEVGGGAAAVVEGDFAGPAARLGFRQPGIVWHWLKAARDRLWLRRMYGA
jgi:hypothetical protein